MRFFALSMLFISSLSVLAADCGRDLHTLRQRVGGALEDAKDLRASMNAKLRLAAAFPGLQPDSARSDLMAFAAEIADLENGLAQIEEHAVSLSEVENFEERLQDLKQRFEAGTKLKNQDPCPWGAIRGTRCREVATRWPEDFN